MIAPLITIAALLIVLSAIQYAQIKIYERRLHAEMLARIDA